MADTLFPTFSVIVMQTAQVPGSEISGLLKTVAAPRPNQSVTVRDLRDEFAAEVVYLREPSAPAHRVTYRELAEAWASAVSLRRVDGDPSKLSVGDAALVVDVACGHLVLEGSL
ncbi:hypothetical protein ACWGOE_07405 [Leucobacter chromiiresistens]